MSFVEDEEIDLIHGDERVHQALIENFCRTNNDHVLVEDFPPSLFRPKVAAHFSAKSFNLLIQIALEHRKLLEDQCHTVHLGAY